MRLPRSEFLAWPRHDQDLLLALREVEAEDESNRCPTCGGDARECQDPANQRAFEAHFTRCYRTKAVARAMDARGDDRDGTSLVASTRFYPDRVKPTT